MGILNSISLFGLKVEVYFEEDGLRDVWFNSLHLLFNIWETVCSWLNINAQGLMMAWRLVGLQ